MCLCCVQRHACPVLLYWPDCLSGVCFSFSTHVAATCCCVYNIYPAGSPATCLEPCCRVLREGIGRDGGCRCKSSTQHHIREPIVCHCHVCCTMRVCGILWVYFGGDMLAAGLCVEGWVCTVGCEGLSAGPVATTAQRSQGFCLVYHQCVSLLSQPCWCCVCAYIAGCVVSRFYIHVCVSPVPHTLPVRYHCHHLCVSVSWRLLLTPPG